jgi:hypothetical protein
MRDDYMFYINWSKNKISDSIREIKENLSKPIEFDLNKELHNLGYIVLAIFLLFGILGLYLLFGEQDTKRILNWIIGAFNPAS